MPSSPSAPEATAAARSTRISAWVDRAPAQPLGVDRNARDPTRVDAAQIGFDQIQRDLARVAGGIRLVEGDGGREWRMALGRQGLVQDALLIGWHEVPTAPGHVFYDRLNAVLGDRVRMCRAQGSSP